MKRIFILGILALTLLMPSSARAAIDLSSVTKPPIIFLPGILGSRLYVVEENGNQSNAWEGSTSLDLSKLAMDESGESVNEVVVGSAVYLFTNNLLRTGFVDIYSSFRAHFWCLPGVSSTVSQQRYAAVNLNNIPGSVDPGYCETPFISYPYDWRYDVFDIVDNGTNYTTGDNVKLIDLVETLSKNPTGKVNIVAHSNGGLLAKALMVRLEEAGKENLIEKIILVGSPQHGTPEAIGTLLHGHGQTKIGGILINPITSRFTSLNSPGAYGLLPSFAYFANSDNKNIVEFSSGTLTNSYRQFYGSSIDSSTELSSFLTDSYSLREKPVSVNIFQPEELNPLLISKAENTHAKIDSWIPPSGIDFIQIVGVGNKTAFGFEYLTQTFKYCPVLSLICFKKDFLDYKPVVNKDGDSTVVHSSAGLNIGTKYFFDFELFEDEEGRRIDHGSFLTNSEIIETIEKILSGETVDSQFFSQERPIFEEEEKIAVSVHSPVLISVSDSNGQISKIEIDDETEIFTISEDIPGSSVEIIGEGKYIILPEGDYTVEITGLDTGSFDVVLSTISTDGKLVDVKTISKIPTKEGSVAKTEVSSGSLSALLLDFENDGEFEYTFSDTDSNKSSIKALLQNSFAELELRPELHSAIEQYFELLENVEDPSEKTNLVAQIQRIIRFLHGKKIDDETAERWTALSEHLQ